MISKNHKGGLGPPPRKFLNFERFYVPFNGVLCVWDRILDSNKLFYFFSSACFFDIISSMYPQNLAKWQKTFSTDPWW